jgi:DNA-binding transcriptional MerR regulator
MATVSVSMGARMLGIHPKTLHHWLAEANMPLAPHPTDARIKCVRKEHLQEVARRHSRPLPDLPSALVLNTGSAPDSRTEPTPLSPTHEGDPPHPAASCASQADLMQRLSCLESKIATLQEQLAGLALALLHERERTVEHRIWTLEALIHPLGGGHLLADPQEQEVKQELAGALHRRHQPLPVEQRARSRLPALIEYGAQGTYVIINSQQGEVHLTPDSAEWFEWLASISSFRFVGQQGRFTAYRHDRLSRSWRAHRRIHQRDYRQLLGTTDQLTIQRLEQVAATLQSHLSSL